MKIETERRFLLTREPSAQPGQRVLRIEQAYSSDGDGPVRGRMTMSDEGVSYHENRKRRVSDMSCEERETEIDAARYAELLRSATAMLRKTRIVVGHGELVWEIDVYDHPLRLAVAEVELPSEDHPVELPPFLAPCVAMEVTGVQGLSNAAIALPPAVFGIG